jgi:two-component system, NtrC family, response regulator AtoC
MSITLLVVDDEENFRMNITDFLESQGFEVIGVPDLASARSCLQRGDGDVILLDVRLPDGYGPNLLHEVAQLSFQHRPPVIMITANGDIEMAVEAMKSGAHDFLTKPIQFSQLEKSIQRASEIVSMRRELDHFRQSQQQQLGFVKGKSKKMKNVFEQAHRAASASVSVLMTGETGTGKEVIARFIHQNGPRVKKPFIDINCAAIQSTMLESELFGYEAGAFTGAERRKIGLMEVADGGILWLDEISSMPLDMQAKLLRAIEEQAFRRVGGTNLIHVDVQILAGSNRNLLTMISEGEFREDLYYRLKVVDINMPPLRERREDIAELAGFLINEYNARQGVNISDITPKAMDVLINYDWPGNVRELRNTIERALLFCDDPAIDIAHLPSDMVNSSVSEQE